MGAALPAGELAARTFTITRDDLVAYARASGDHNPIHQDEDVARSVGLPGVIAHGMYTLALAARYVEEQAGGRGEVASIGAKFTKPVVVPAEGVEVSVSGVVKDDGTIAVTVTCDGVSVLGRCQATLRA
ncbi:acyl dehydratase [Nocardioides dongxiaopingii]|uniref:MaoC/PaaZ C-terminal domain-containing protein n=1 Tax=Nocardioides TaxID=1839 RepID=UPI0010C76E17|nr:MULTISPECIES: MaoC/PaaZ C-terminal domain-containing protein [Nocardioides]QCW51686.1 acyl dehydratase [Nocardioides sp. S-1144]